jgi:hypothetical protein
MRHAFAVALVSLSISAPAQDRSHRGAVNPEVTQENIQRTICDWRWRELERPARGFINAIKKRWTPSGHNSWEYRLDHIIPLCAGGALYDEENLRLEPWREAREKDELEARTCDAICNGSMSLKEGQDRFRR